MGEVLESQGLVTREALLRALRNQKVVGGKLGTCLLEIDALPEDVLLRALAQQQGVEAAGTEDLRGIPDEVIRLVPAKVARRLLAVPFRASGTSAHVALIDARDLAALDELAFVSGRRIRPYVASEARILEAIQRHYGVECPPRIVKLLDRLNRARYLWAPAKEETTQAVPEPELLRWDPGLGTPSPGATAPTSEPLAEAPATAATMAPAEQPPMPAAPPPPATAGASAPPEPPAAPSVLAPPLAAEPIAPPARPEPPPTAEAPAPAPAVVAPLETTPTPSAPPGTSIEAPAPAPSPAAPPAPISIDDAEQRLLDPRDRDDVARTLLEFAAGHARRALLFKVQRDEVAAWMAAGTELDVGRFADYRTRFDRPSLFVALQSGPHEIRGPLAPLPAHQGILAAFSGAAATDGIALPIRVRDRLVAVLYAEPAGPAFPAATVGEFQRLGPKAAIAFELCILRAKLRRG